jgi:hypothetical protein
MSFTPKKATRSHGKKAGRDFNQNAIWGKGNEAFQPIFGV